jgi:hypothetical protein
MWPHRSGSLNISRYTYITSPAGQSCGDLGHEKIRNLMPPPAPSLAGSNLSTRPVSTSTEAISVLKWVASMASSIAPPQVDGLRIVVIYFGVGRLGMEVNI